MAYAAEVKVREDNETKEANERDERGQRTTLPCWVYGASHPVDPSPPEMTTAVQSDVYLREIQIFVAPSSTNQDFTEMWPFGHFQVCLKTPMSLTLSEAEIERARCSLPTGT